MGATINMKRGAYLFDILFCILIVLLIVSNCYSLLITPGRTTINYEKGLVKDYSFSIVNNEKKELQIMFMIQGELNQSITLYDNLVSYTKDQESKEFKFKVSLSDSLATNPGLHEAEIVALEIPKEKSGTYVGATVAVSSLISVHIPYPGKYLDADLNIMSGEENSTATFIVPIINRGKVGISDAKAIIDIYDLANNKITSVNTESVKVDSGQRAELTGKWNVNVTSGDYIGKVTVLYDGETREIKKQFAIGVQSISLGGITVNNFRLGEIAKLQILVENKWSQDMKEVYANLIVYNNDNQVMADVKSPNEQIAALSKKELIAFWDTAGVKEGEYNGKLMVKYDKKSSDKNLVLSVKEDSLNFVGMGYAINSSPKKGMDMSSILIIVIVILILVNLSWFIMFRRFMNKKK